MCCFLDRRFFVGWPLLCRLLFAVFCLLFVNCGLVFVVLGLVVWLLLFVMCCLYVFQLVVCCQSIGVRCWLVGWLFHVSFFLLCRLVSLLLFIDFSIMFA